MWTVNAILFEQVSTAEGKQGRAQIYNRRVHSDTRL